MTDDKLNARAEEPLFSRWSRLKKEAAAASALPAEVEPKGEAEPIALPPVESLTPASDFSVFMGPRVAPELRQAALKRLFADPHFNVMDGLDIYIDDYTRPDPIAASIVSELVQFQNLERVDVGPPQADAKDATGGSNTDCADATKTLSDSPEDHADVHGEPARDDVNVAALPSDTKSRTPNSVAQFVAPDSGSQSDLVRTRE
jgi:hypothetical protein